MKRMGYLDTTQYCSVIKKDHIMTFPSTRRKVEVIILSEAGETGKDKNHMVSLLDDTIKMETDELLYQREMASEGKEMGGEK